MRVGFVGLGLMGAPMAAGVLSSGFPVSAYDINEEAVKELARRGAVPARSPAEAAERADVLITMLPGPPQIEAAMLGPKGALAAMQPGSAWIDMSSSSFTTAQRIVDVAGPADIAMLDAPVTGGVPGAQERTLQIFVGGDKEVFERHLAVLGAMGDSDRIFHVGGRGAGYTVKLCLNLLFFIHVAGGAEVLARENGVPLEVSALVEQVHRRALAQYGDGGQLFAVRLLEDLAQVSLRT